MPWDTETTSDTVDPFICSICKSDECVPPSGDEDSLVLLIEEFPGSEEIIKGRPFIGRTGTIIRNELIRAGYQLSAFRIMNLWRHPPNKNEQCFELGVKECLKEAKNKKLVVLIGSETVKYFTGKNVSEWNGLLVTSPMLSCDKILAVVQPATVFHSSVGEMKYSMQRLVHYLKEAENE